MPDGLFEWLTDDSEGSVASLCDGCVIGLSGSALKQNRNSQYVVAIAQLKP